MHRLAVALGLSIAALIAAVVIQATLLFPEHVQTLHDPVETSVRQLSLFSDGQRAIALLRHSQRALPNQPEFTLRLYELDEKRLSHSIDAAFAPWIVAGARDAELVFVGSREGDLHCFDPTAPALQSRLLGRHPEGSPMILECTRDGSIVILGDGGCISAWSSETATCLWRRSDISVVGAHFDAANRLFCGLVEWPCVELDCQTGATLRTFAAHREAALSLDVSADGRYLATLGFHGRYAVTDLQTGRELWSKRFPLTGFRPRFSPDGKRVMTAAPERVPVVQALSTLTGELLAELRGAKGQIIGIEVTDSGIVYAWDASGTLTAWDLATRTLLRQHKLTPT